MSGTHTNCKLHIGGEEYITTFHIIYIQIEVNLWMLCIVKSLNEKRQTFLTFKNIVCMFVNLQ
jgi:hypothetical protein